MVPYVIQRQTDDSKITDWPALAIWHHQCQ